MKILVTGGTGFIGSHLIKSLIDGGYETRCLVRRNKNVDNLQELGAELVYGDVTEAKSIGDAFAGIDVVYHLAGFLGRWGIPDQVYWNTNVKGTQNMLEKSYEYDIKKFIYCSSAGVTGPVSLIPQDELAPYNPTNIYELTKAEAEKCVLNFYHEKGLPVIVIRPEFIYGPMDKHTFQLFRIISDKKFILIDGGRAVWHPTYIDDLISSFKLCLTSQKAIGQCYLIAGERYLTIKEFSSKIANALNVPNTKLAIPKNMALLLATGLEKLGEILNFDPPLSKSRVKTFCGNRAFNTAKARKDLGYVPTVTIDEGIQRTANWYKQNGWL